jgi:hypothetical protein
MKTNQLASALALFLTVVIASGQDSGANKKVDAPLLQGPSTFAQRPAPEGTTSSADKNVAVARALERMPLYFIENRGQLDPSVAYYVQGRDTTLYFTAGGMTLVQTERRQEKNGSTGRLEKASFGRDAIPTPEASGRWVVKLGFVGANPKPRIEAKDPAPAAISYFKGPKEKWETGLSTYGSIVYSDLWPGIDLVYSGTANRLKYTFLVKPGADPARVRLAYRGVRGIRLNEAGQLEIETPAGGFRDDKPYAYQEVDGRRVEIKAAYSLDRRSAGGPHRYGFALASYDRARPLVLDPAVLVYAGYIGGSGDDEARGIAVDSSGNAYVTGYTNSTQATFPVTVGPKLTSNGGYDAFVAKVNAAGALVYCGYIGGSGDDYGLGIAVDGSGNAYITGQTNSTEATFPVTVGPKLTFNGGQDAFVAKVNAAGTALLYCGYIGGSGDDVGFAIAVDSSGNAYVTGRTSSTEATFPVTVGPGLTYNGGLFDAFAAKVNAAGTALLYCGYIGGSGADYGFAIAVDGSGNAYVTGRTNSNEATFPVTVGPGLTYKGGLYDAFVAKITLSTVGTNYFTVSPCRVADTRNPIGPYGGPALAANADRTFVIATQCGIPLTARAVSFNLTVTLPTALGDLRVFPAGAGLPLVSALNWRPGQTRANNAIVTLGPAGNIGVHVDQGSGTVHFIIDVNGYFQ